jgi:hypothetical protein
MLKQVNSTVLQGFEPYRTPKVFIATICRLYPEEPRLVSLFAVYWYHFGRSELNKYAAANAPTSESLLYPLASKIVGFYDCS